MHFIYYRICQNISKASYTYSHKVRRIFPLQTVFLNGPFGTGVEYWCFFSHYLPSVWRPLSRRSLKLSLCSEIFQRLLVWRLLGHQVSCCWAFRLCWIMGIQTWMSDWVRGLRSRQRPPSEGKCTGNDHQYQYFINIFYQLTIYMGAHAPLL